MVGWEDSCPDAEGEDKHEVRLLPAVLGRAFEGFGDLPAVSGEAATFAAGPIQIMGRELIVVVFGGQRRGRKRHCYETARAMIDTTFDFRTDAGGRDPDTFSATLCRYHRILWSKPLPTGILFELSATTTPPYYLRHRSHLGEFWLSSDAVIATFTTYWLMRHIVNQLPEAENEAFNAIGYTIGGMLLFPGNKIGAKMTINGARGFSPRIRDRLDLTLECIRRHYRSDDSPLSATLDLYHDFFMLFGDFRGYVDFFLLQDLVTTDALQVRFWMPFDDFTTSALPRDIETYTEYRRRSIDFVTARNRRIHQWDLESRHQTKERDWNRGTT